MKFKLTPIATIKKVKYFGRVYDLQIAEDHSYNINGIAVHNSACTTRTQVGIGVPQLSAVYLINKAMTDMGNRNQVHLIADGGIRSPGDSVKYLAAGADGIMMGRALSQTIESAGWIEDPGIEIQGRMMVRTGEPRVYKQYRGQASAEFQKAILGKANRCPEGASSKDIEPTGTIEETVEQYRGGVASAISYLGFESIEEIKPDKVHFIKVTNAGYQEGTPHGTR